MKKYIGVLLILMVSTMAVGASSDKVAEKVKNVDYNKLINAKVEDLPIITEDRVSGVARADYIYYGKFAFGMNAISSYQTTTISDYCYKRFGKWYSTPIYYVINPSNSQGISQTTITSNIYGAAETWDSVVSRNLFSDTYGIDYGVHYGVYDQKNVIDFSAISNSGIIAVTSIWYNIYTKQIYEFDIRFNNALKWGDAMSNSYPYLMDIRNIATHEIGHGAGLNDLYQSYCSQQTMYGYSDYRETKKRTLESGDIRGIQSIYGT